ncbi:MAG TPA: cytochrome c biogenesis protein CcsA [Longimicrobiaceae bacterium]
MMDRLAHADLAALHPLRRWADRLTVLGGLAVLGALWMVFFYAPTEREMGVIQRIYYIHVPTAWLGELAIGILALCSLGYLWLRDDRLDAIALSAAELAFLFLTATLAAGPLWARIAWGAWWVWDARLSFTLILWFINLGYFMLRGASDSPEQGKRFAAILALIAAVDVPLIHMSVYWFRTQHPKPVVMNPEGPTASTEIVQTLLFSTLAFTIMFAGLLLHRYAYERLKRHVDGLRFARDDREAYMSPSGGAAR